MPLLSLFTPLGLLRLTSKASDAEAMYDAKIAALGGQYGTPPDAHIDAKAYAEAIEEAVIRSCIERAGGQAFPAELAEMLPVREAEYGAVPAIGASIADRRGALAALARLPLGNSRNNVENSLRDLLGANFVRYYTPSSGDPSESVDWPTNLGDQPMNLQRPEVLAKVIKLTSPVSTLGVPLTVSYKVATPNAQPDPYIPHLVDGDVLVLSPDSLGHEERVTVSHCASTGPTTGTFAATFTGAHDRNSLATTQPWPEWASTRRRVMVVVKAAAAVDPVIRAKIDDLMGRMMREVTQWSIVAETIVGGVSTFGPFVFGVSPLSATPFASEGAPSVLSALVSNVLPVVIKVTFDRPVTYTAFTATSLVFSVGTPKTILSVAGNGTATHLYTLSGSIKYSDVLSVFYGLGNQHYDARGNHLASVTVPVGNGVLEDILDVPNLYEYWDTTTGLTASGGIVNGANVLSWLGQVAGLTLGNIGAHYPTVTVNGFSDGAVDVSFDGTSPQTLNMLSLNLSGTNKVTAFLLLRGNYGGSAGVIFEHGNNYTSDSRTIELEDGGTSGFVAHTLGDVGLDTWTSSASLAGTKRHYLEVQYDYSQGAGSELAAILDTASSGSATASANNTTTFNNDVFNLGARVTPSLGGTFKIAALGFIKGIPSSGDRAVIRAALKRRFPAMV